MNNIDQENLQRLKDILNKHHCQYFRILKRKENQDLVKWIEEKTPLLNDSYYKIGTKIIWVLEGITKFPKCKNPNCNKEFRYNVGLRSRSYRNFCSQKCAGICSKEKVEQTKFERYGDPHYVNKEQGSNTTFLRYGTYSNMQSEKGKAEYLEGLQKKYGPDIINVFQTEQAKRKSKETKKIKYGDENYHNVEKMKETISKRSKEEWNIITKKAEQTRLEKYGYRYPKQDPKYRNSTKGTRYFYDNTYFDSKEEVSLYLFLKGNEIDFKYHDGTYFLYTFNGKEYYYIPDFKINGNYYEVKGSQFFKDKRYKMSNPYTKNENDNLKMEAKYNCMVENGVILLKDSDEMIIKSISYVKEHYGKKFFNSIKILKSKKV